MNAVLISIFLIAVPSLSQVHYSSHTGPVSDPESPTTVPAPSDFGSPSGAGNVSVDENVTLTADQTIGAAFSSSYVTKKNSIKKANLYAWLSLPPLPEVCFFLLLHNCCFLSTS